jgi:hypothetical protein
MVINILSMLYEISEGLISGGFAVTKDVFRQFRHIKN